MPMISSNPTLLSPMANSESKMKSPESCRPISPVHNEPIKYLKTEVTDTAVKQVCNDSIVILFLLLCVAPIFNFIVIVAGKARDMGEDRLDKVKPKLYPSLKKAFRNLKTLATSVQNRDSDY